MYNRFMNKPELKKPEILFAGEAFIGDDGKLYETVESYYKKMVNLGVMVGNAVLSGEILRPTRIVSIPRGSLLVTDTVARMLKMTGDQVVSYGLSLYSDEQRNDRFRIGQRPPRELIEQEIVLVVDEVADTTKTLERAKIDLQELDPFRLYTAAVYDKLMPNTCRPDFVAAHTDEHDRWIVFPNEPLEEYGKAFEANLE